MKKTITITEDDGMKGSQPQTAQQGQRGDTELAHVNSWEKSLLQALGGAGTQNPNTGLKQFYPAAPAQPQQRTNPLVEGFRPIVRQMAQKMAQRQAPNLAQQGIKGDTAVMPVNSYQEQLLKALGGAGTKNPNTGLKQFYNQDQMGKDWTSFFTGSMGYDPINWGGGQLQLQPTSYYNQGGNTGAWGMATYTDPSGKAYKFTQETPFADVAAFNPAIADLWNQQYGWNAPNNDQGLPKSGATPVPTGFNMQQDWDAFFSGAAGYQPISWGGGTVQLGQNGVATYTDPYGGTHYFNKNTPFNEVAAYNPQVGLEWNSRYGYDVPVQEDTGPLTNFPTDIMPSSGSTSTSYSGLSQEYLNPLMEAIMPYLTDQISNRNKYIDEYTGQAQSQYLQTLNNALRTNIPASVGQLANRGILSSTAGENVLSDVYAQAARDASTKGYDTAMQAALSKAQWPEVLAQIANLGKGSTSSSASYSQDPTAMYGIFANLILGL